MPPAPPLPAPARPDPHRHTRSLDRTVLQSPGSHASPAPPFVCIARTCPHPSPRGSTPRYRQPFPSLEVLPPLSTIPATRTSPVTSPVPLVTALPRAPLALAPPSHATASRSQVPPSVSSRTAARSPGPATRPSQETPRTSPDAAAPRTSAACVPSEPYPPPLLRIRPAPAVHGSPAAPRPHSSPADSRPAAARSLL